MENTTLMLAILLLVLLLILVYICGGNNLNLRINRDMSSIDDAIKASDDDASEGFHNPRFGQRPSAGGFLPPLSNSKRTSNPRASINNKSKVSVQKDVLSDKTVAQLTEIGRDRSPRLSYNEIQAAPIRSLNTAFAPKKTDKGIRQSRITAERLKRSNEDALDFYGDNMPRDLYPDVLPNNIVLDRIEPTGKRKYNTPIKEFTINRIRFVK